MKKSLFCTLLLTLVTTLSFGQKKYVQPPPILGDGFKIIISEIESLNNDSRFKLEIFNDSRDQYLTIDPEQIGIEYPGLGMYLSSYTGLTSKKNKVLEPGSKKTINVKVAGDFDHKSATMQIHLKGVRMGPLAGEIMSLQTMELAEGKSGETQTKALIISVEKVKQSKDVLVATTEFKFSPSNTENELYLFDPSTITATSNGGPGVVLKVTPNKLSEIDFDSDLKVTLKAEGVHPSIMVDWGKSLKRIMLTDIDIPVFTVTDKASTKLATRPTPTRGTTPAPVEQVVTEKPQPVAEATPPAPTPKPTPAPVVDNRSVSTNPKVKEKKGLITLDDVEYMTVRKEGKIYIYSNLNGDIVLETKFVTYNDRAQVSDANPEGKVHYVELYFAGSKVYGEKTAGFSMKKKIPGILYMRKIVPLNGILDPVKADAYINTLGTPHTQRRKELYPEVIIEREVILVKQRETIIIEKQGESKKRDININVGGIKIGND